ncbi:KxYKxGKxW signal peptide domain-containing protein [Leuconostoc lactis]|uniref:KxYKxGKxW signal peptide domain-containing protein n=1 Tax=Leuconostoc lactis TaxID=1246 RepID=UPI0006DC7CF5|nr:KxYKxGKxW signal peptide domain-containing protein [Leuconostoc lactis]KQB80219.1 aggregation substance precursor [Leuconostoc lactis]
MPIKKYKLYKDGKSLVIGAIAVAGVMATTGVSQVSADTVTPSDTAQAVQTVSTAQSDKQVVLQPAQSTDTAVKTGTTPAVTSDVPTTVPANTTQDDAKKAVDTAQDGVKSDVDTAQKAGVNVTTGATQNVTINKDNAVSKVNSILSDLNKQDQAVKQATATQVANQKAYDTATKDRDDAVNQGQSDLGSATDNLNKQVGATQKAGIEVSVALSKTSPKYQSLQGLTGQDLLDAMAKNITLYKEAIASGVASETADTIKLEALVAEYQENQADFAQATNDRDATVKQGQADLAAAQANLDKAVASATTSGIQVSTALSQLSPEYKALTGLTGQDLLDAMAYNKDLYQKAVVQGVATETQDTQTLAALTTEYNQEVAQYQANKAQVDQENADKKAAYDKALQDYLNATNHNTVMQAQTDTDMATGQYKTFMTAVVDQNTGEFSLKHDMNDGVSIIGQGELKGKVNYQVTSNGDGTETVKVTSIDLYSYTYTNLNVNTAVNKNINFHVYDNNGNELYSRYHDGQSTFSDTINKTFGLNETFTLTPGQQSDLFDFLKIDDNWIYDTHGKVFIAFQNTNKAPDLPNYNPEPAAPAVPSAAVHKVTVAELPMPEAPIAPKTGVTKITVDEMPQAEAPAPQQVDVHYYNVSTTPDVPAPTPTATPVTPAPRVVEASILPHTGANEMSDLSILSALTGIASLGLLGAMRKFKKE